MSVLMYMLIISVLMADYSLTWPGVHTLLFFFYSLAASLTTFKSGKRQKTWFGEEEKITPLDESLTPHLFPVKQHRVPLSV